jgi:hypothetical protein
MTLSINGTRYSHAEHYAECRCADCHILFTVMPSVIMLNVNMLSVVAPFYPFLTFLKKSFSVLAGFQFGLKTSS